MGNAEKNLTHILVVTLRIPLVQSIERQESFLLHYHSLKTLCLISVVRVSAERVGSLANWVAEPMCHYPRKDNFQSLLLLNVVDVPSMTKITYTGFYLRTW